MTSDPRSSSAEARPRVATHGVRILGTGSAVPEQVLTNNDLESLMDTSDEWIVQRTGIRERRVIEVGRESTFTLSRDALRKALNNTGVSASEVDLLLLATVSGEMACPSVACRVAANVGMAPAPALDLVAACCGFVYAMNLADSLMRSGRYDTIAVIGCDTMSSLVDYNDRSVSILFGDAGGAAILRRDPDPEIGCIEQVMCADGSNWPSLYIPRRVADVPESDRDNPISLGRLRMHGREIFRFAVKQMRELIEGVLERTGMSVNDVDQFVCHQSNRRILEAARDKLGIPEDRMSINIDHYGNSSGGSAPLVFDQLWQCGRVGRGSTVMFVAIGGGMTWTASLWKL